MLAAVPSAGQTESAYERELQAADEAAATLRAGRRTTAEQWLALRRVVGGFVSEPPAAVWRKAEELADVAAGAAADSDASATADGAHHTPGEAMECAACEEPTVVAPRVEGARTRAARAVAEAAKDGAWIVWRAAAEWRRAAAAANGAGRRRPERRREQHGE